MRHELRAETEIPPPQSITEDAGMVNLNTLSVESARAHRLALLSREDALPPTERTFTEFGRYRLGIGPVVRCKLERALNGFDDETLSSLILHSLYLEVGSLQLKQPLLSEHPEQEPSTDTVLKWGLASRLAVRFALEAIVFDPSVAKTILSSIRNDERLSKELLFCFMRAEDELHRYQRFEKTCRHVLGCALIWTHRLSGSVGFKISSDFVKTFCYFSKKLSRESSFVRTDHSAPTNIHLEPDFEGIRSALTSHSSLAQWIESQPYIFRPDMPNIAQPQLIRDLKHFPYDRTRVREFTIADDKGEKLHIVSKRLHPIKSRWAEHEFGVSKHLFKCGVPTPTPIGTVQDEGNTYFLWSKIESDPWLPEQYPIEAKKLVSSLKQQLRTLGFEQEDWAPRNLLWREEEGSLKVYLIDLERVVRL